MLLGAETVSNETVGRVVRRNSYRYPISNQHSDLKLLHAAGKAGRNRLPGVEQNVEASTGYVRYLAFCADEIFPSH